MRLDQILTPDILLSFAKNQTGYTPWKDDIETDTVIKGFLDGQQVVTIWCNKIQDVIEIEYAEVAERFRSKGVYTQTLRLLQKQFSIISDIPQNNAAKSSYALLGAYELSNGRFKLKKKL
jgi:hypothetical protein